ncbi:iron ABC transporter permease [Paenibacillus sp. GSMTC-2017]|uniref:FecCD family ABC transporter permease n=1 Tax=Paenibacillus sp. GSMTC-2017 TaxID=2794350 RepID=UPI0018D5E48D|nr:iron ABC transporter permease [Paenibacillus sp. GSMTC-2017]MBH5319224.1 iron ABC transporter permease [Paenibacillus sp. GSMTC-2017]
MSKSRIRYVMGLSLLLVALSAVYLMLGDQFIAPMDVWNALLGKGDGEQIFIVQTLRAPRLIIGLLIGVSLAVSGAILQSIVRNPLAAPDVVGITGGASAGAVLFLTRFPGLFSVHLLPIPAMVGALISALVVYSLSWKGGVSSNRLVLVGIGVAAILSAITSYLLIFSPIYSATAAYIWLTGTVYATTWTNVITLLPWTVGLLIIVGLTTRHVHVQLLGDELATGLGSAVQRHRFLLLLLSVGLAGSAVSIGGVIGFVGLMAPHMARRLIGPVMNRVLPVSALIGAILVVAADLIGRVAFLPHDIPVGVFTAAIGAPFFIYLLYRSRNQG